MDDIGKYNNDKSDDESVLYVDKRSDSTQLDYDGSNDVKGGWVDDENRMTMDDSCNNSLYNNGGQLNDHLIVKGGSTDNQGLNNNNSSSNVGGTNNIKSYNNNRLYDFGI